MRASKLFKVTAITLAVVAVLLLLSVAVFVFNPLEGALRDMRDVVPRDVDFFVRKLDLSDDFKSFPEPLFWDELSAHPAWRGVTRGPLYRSFDGAGEITRALEDVRAQIEQVREQTSGYLDVVDDVLGREVELAGKFGATSADTKWCLYARVNWPVKAGLGLSRYGFVQERARRAGVLLAADEDLLKIEPQNGETLWAVRHLDCLLVGNDRDLVRRSHNLATGVGDPDSFGGSASYRDGVERRIQEWEDRADEIANAAEFYVRPDKLFGLPSVSFDDTWPDPNHPTDMNSRVLAAFLNLESWLFLSGAAVFEEGSVSLLADLELNQNKHTPFQSRFFQAESQQRSEWLDRFLSMVPASACACAALRMPAGEFMREMYVALTDVEKELINDGLRGTGQFEDVMAVINKLEPALEQRTGFVFRKNIPDPEIPVADTSPVPQVAWVFWMRRGGRPLVQEFVDMVTRYREVLGFTNAYDLPLGLGGQGVGGDAAREFTNPQIPGTGSIATLVYPPFFVISNSGPFIRDLMQTLITPDQRRSIRSREDFQEYLFELPDAINGLVYIQAPELRELLDDYLQGVARSASLPDPDWAVTQRGAAESAVFAREYAQRFGSMAAIPQAQRGEFDDKVDREIEEMWRTQRTSFSAEAQASLLEARALTELFSSAYFQVTLEPRHLRLTGRAKANFR